MVSRSRRRIVLVVSLIGIGLIALALQAPIRIRLYDRAFAKIARGMSEPEVAELMGRPERIDAGADRAFWNDAGLEPPIANEVRRQYGYNVNTFFLPISWSIGFDDKGLVISKHPWD